MIAGQILKEIYTMVYAFFMLMFIVTYLTLFISYIVRIAIRYVNDGDYEINYFFTKKNKLINFLTKSLTKDTDEPVLVILLGMIWIPFVYFILIIAWPITFTVLAIVGLLKGLRYIVRFMKQVRKHMEHL
jgi:hypothetical protein